MRNLDWTVLQQLLGERALEGVMIQAVALHTQGPFPAAPGVGGDFLADGFTGGSFDRVGQSGDAAMHCWRSNCESRNQPLAKN